MKSSNLKLIKAKGIDISHYQGDELIHDGSYLKKVDFIICKGTEGIEYIDPMFHENWEKIKTLEKIRGAYHFYLSKEDPIKQAHLFYKTLSDYSSKDLPLICDFEEAGIDSDQLKRVITKDLRMFLQKIEELSGVRPILYTDNNVANGFLTDPYFANYPLWIADYDNRDQPVLPKAWKDNGWIFWQKTDDYSIDNLENDLDVFNGTLLELEEFISDSHQEAGKMKKYEH